MRTVPVVMLSTVLVSGASRAQESCEHRFFPDRPGAAADHRVVGARCFMLEGATSVYRAPDVTGLSFPLLARFGIDDIFELRFSNAIVGIVVPDQASADVQATPLGLEGKLTGIEAAGRAPGIGVLFGTWAPLGDRFFDDIDPRLTLLFDWEMVETLTLSLNARLSAPPTDEEIRFARASGAAELAWRWRWLELYADTTGGIGLREGQVWQQWVGGGVAFFPADNVEIDALGRAEIPLHDVTQVVAELGFAWRL